MAGQPKQRALLASDIAAVLSAVGQQKPATRALLMTGVALVCLQPDSASALTLGQLQVKSTLGAPFVSTTMARIGSGESLGEKCLSSVATPDGGMTLPQDLDVAVSETSTPGEYPVRISSRTPMYEPMYEIRLQVKCSGNVTFIRDYVVMLNLPMTSPQTQPANTVSGSAPQKQAAPQRQTLQNTAAKADQAQPRATEQPQTAAGAMDMANEPAGPAAPETDTEAVNTATPAADPRPYTERFATPSAPIDSGSEYQVQSGDMLSTIAQRIQDRPEIAARDMADLVFQMNPDAFVDSDPNRVRLGAVLRIPSANELLADRRQLPVESQPQPADTNELVMESPDLDLAADTAADEIVVENVAPEPEAITEAIPDSIAEATVETAPEVSVDEVSAETTIDVVPDVIEATPAPLVAVSAPAVPATEPELEIVVDISDALEPVTDIEQVELVTAAERALTPDAAEQDLAEVAGSDEGMGMHPLLIAGLGALLGCVLAALLLGRRLLDFLIPGRKSRTTDEAMQTLGLPAQNGEGPHDEAPQLGDPNLGETEFEATAEIADTGMAPDVTQDQPEFAEADTSDLATEFANTDVDLDVSGTHSDTSLDLDLSQTDVDTSELPPSMDAPRVSLDDDVVSLDDDIEDTFAGELPLESTTKFSAPDFSLDGSEATGEQSELEGTSTMRKLFSRKPKPQQSAPEPADDDFAVTEEMPELDNGSPLDPTSDLQTLAEHADTEDPDDKLARTLTQALGLLEKDYEDEFSASQVLEQKDIKEAFAEHSKKE